MTIAEAIAILSRLPPTMLLCHTVQIDGVDQIAETTQIEVVAVTATGERYAATDDGRPEGAIEMAVVA